MINCYYHLLIEIILPRAINYKDTAEYLTSRVNFAMLKDLYTKTLHEKRGMKGYVISGLTPIEKDRIYKQNKPYLFQINTNNFVLALKLKECLEQLDDIVSVKIKQESFKENITELMTTTSMVIQLGEKNDQRYWTLDDSIILLYRRLTENIKHKAQTFFELPESELQQIDTFIESIEIRNKMDIINNYKGGKIFASSIFIKVKDDPMSQIFANIALATGLGEKNSIGYGYCTERRKNDTRIT